jgi:transcriptional regulator with GAF, ATPase, and Fis domain
MRFDSSYLDSINSGHDLHIVPRPSVGDDVDNSPRELLGRAEITGNFTMDSLHQIARQTAMGETLDEVLATAFTFINTLVDSESCIAYVLHAGRFEAWIWQTPKAGRDFAHTLTKELQRSLSEHKVPVAHTSAPTTDRRVRVFEHWSRDPGETFISIPLVSRVKLVGAINVRHAPRVYPQRDAKLLSTLGFIIGADIGISLAEAENAALREDFERRNG